MLAILPKATSTTFSTSVIDEPSSNDCLTKLSNPYPNWNPTAVFNRFTRLKRAESTCFPELPICRNAETIPLANFFIEVSVLPPILDKRLNALTTEFVALFTLPPDDASCARACVMRIVFSLILGAFSIV